MALLVTSCTMRNKPSRLLDKGPGYLKTRTNDQMFAHRRQSAVELLAASRPRYVKSTAVLDSTAILLAGTPDRHFRSICHPKERPPVRCKSEFDISKLHQLFTQDLLDSDSVSGETSGPKGKEGTSEESTAARGTPGAEPTVPVGQGGKINKAADKHHEPSPSLHQPAAVSSLPSSAMQTFAPTVFSARPVYISLSGSTCPNRQVTFSRAGTPTTHHHTISVISQDPSQALLVPSVAMSEESSDKTPTNPLCALVTPTETPSSAISQLDGENKEGGLSIPASISVSAVAAASPSSHPGPVGSAPSSAEFCTASAQGNQCPVPRSFSDIACHHSRAGSDVSSEASRASRTSRASRASAGANLERFFNEMGMDRETLDPLILLQRRHFGDSQPDVYESVSSLDSHDAGSICSALSRSQREISEAESFERNQQQTSVVERNARIIKWLCSVKKAKTPASSVQGSAAS